MIRYDVMIFELSIINDVIYINFIFKMSIKKCDKCDKLLSTLNELHSICSEYEDQQNKLISEVCEYKKAHDEENRLLRAEIANLKSQQVQGGHNAALSVCLYIFFMYIFMVFYN